MTRTSGKTNLHWSKRSIDITQKPLDLGPGDAVYVRKVLALGGFIYNARLPDERLVTVRP
jgi:hypothetical protein